MASLTEIYKLRTQIEFGTQKHFTENYLAAITRENRPERFLQARPRYEIKASLGAATGRRHYCPDNIVRFDAFRFILAIQVVTNPASAGSSNGAHEEFVSKARELMATAAQKSWTDDSNFPLVQIVEPLRDSGSESTLKAEDGVEYTTISFSGIVGIRPSAWEGFTADSVEATYRVQLKDPATGLWVSIGVNDKQINLAGSDCRFDPAEGLQLMDPAEGIWKSVKVNDGQLQLDPA